MKKKCPENVPARWALSNVALGTPGVAREGSGRIAMFLS